eukprot:SAG11_NODE_18999_length_476_cov_0.827586_1_plen_65_part_01
MKLNIMCVSLATGLATSHHLNSMYCWRVPRTTRRQYWFGCRRHHRQRALQLKTVVVIFNYRMHGI